MKRRRSSIRRRALIIVTVVATVCLAVPLFLVGSIWSESRFPSDAPDSSALARVRGALTRPVVDAVASHLRGQLRRHVRSAFENRMAMTGLSFEETLARLRDDTLSDEERGIYALRLARVGSPEAVEALRDLLLQATPEQRAFLAQLLGSTGDASVAPWLRPLLHDTDPAVVIAAVRGLCALEGYDATDDVAPLLCSTATEPNIRAEAALGLGQLGTAAAREVLTSMLGATQGSDLSLHILDGLGHFRFQDVATTFEGVVHSPRTSQEERVVAVEALFHSTPDAVPFLMDVTRTHLDPQTRASAAWAIGAFEGAPDLGSQLVDIAAGEPSADVRRRVYESLLPQREIPTGRLLALVASETDVAARVAGTNAVAEAIGRDPADAGARRFDDAIVPELTRIATHPNSLNIRMRAVFALRRAHTPAARAALSEIATGDCEQVAAAARHGLTSTGGD